jgi:hypothetical protein
MHVNTSTANAADAFFSSARDSPWLPKLGVFLEATKDLKRGIVDPLMWAEKRTVRLLSQPLSTFAHRTMANTSGRARQERGLAVKFATVRTNGDKAPLVAYWRAANASADL